MEALTRIKSIGWLKPAVVPIAIVAIVVTALALTSAPWRSVSMTMLWTMVCVLGLYLFTGNSGVFSLGHGSFVAMGAYTAIIFGSATQMKHNVMAYLPDVLEGFSLGPFLGIVVGGIFAAIFAAIISVPMMRMKLMVLPIGTFALLVMVHQTTIALRKITNGTATVTTPVRMTPWILLGFVAVVILIALWFQHSRIGRRLKASREDEVAARAVGISILKERIVAFVLSAFVAGMGGGLAAFSLGIVYPDMFWVGLLMMMMLMLVVGGMRSLGGVVTGTVVISVLSELLRRVEGGVSIGSLNIPGKPGVRDMILAVILLVVLILRPAGIMGASEYGLWPRFMRRRKAKTPKEESGLSVDAG